MNIFSELENFLHPPKKCAEGSEGSAEAAKAANYVFSIYANIE